MITDKAQHAAEQDRIADLAAAELRAAMTRLCALPEADRGPAALLLAASLLGSLASTVEGEGSGEEIIRRCVGLASLTLDEFRAAASAAALALAAEHP